MFSKVTASSARFMSQARSTPGPSPALQHPGFVGHRTADLLVVEPFAKAAAAHGPAALLVSSSRSPPNKRSLDSGDDDDVIFVSAASPSELRDREGDAAAGPRESAAAATQRGGRGAAAGSRLAAGVAEAQLLLHGTTQRLRPSKAAAGAAGLPGGAVPEQAAAAGPAPKRSARLQAQTEKHQLVITDFVQGRKGGATQGGKPAK